MSICLGVPYRTYDDVRVFAEEFLRKHHPGRSIPVPIERIVEKHLRLGIFPVPDLMIDLDTDGFLTSDLQEIYVDSQICSRVPARYNFTLAHEVGHLVMHAALYREYVFTEVHEWKAFHDNLSEKSRARFELQAYDFAGLVLVPKDHLLCAVDQQLKEMPAEWKGVGAESIPPRAVEERLRAAISQRICRSFEVSSQVIEKRLEKEGIIVSGR